MANLITIGGVFPINIVRLGNGKVQFTDVRGDRYQVFNRNRAKSKLTVKQFRKIIENNYDFWDLSEKYWLVVDGRSVSL